MTLNPKIVQKIRANRSRPRDGSSTDAAVLAWLDDYFGQLYKVQEAGLYERELRERGSKEPVLLRYVIDRSSEWRAPVDLSGLAGSAAAYVAIYRPHADAGMLVKIAAIGGRPAVSWSELTMKAEAIFSIDDGQT
jgi:hypothetical protein